VDRFMRKYGMGGSDSATGTKKAANPAESSTEETAAKA
jgi:hypothetical protein